MLVRNLSFLPPVRKSYFERAATKTRLNQFREGTPRECRAFSRCARHSLRCTMARLRERGQRLPPGPLRPWRARHPPTGFPEISPRSIRLQWSLAYCQTTPNSQSTRRTTTMLPREIGRYISIPQALLVGLSWSSETRSKASGRTAVWAGSIRARFSCQPRLVQIYIGCDEIAIAKRSGWLSQERRSTTLRCISAD